MSDYAVHEWIFNHLEVLPKWTDAPAGVAKRELAFHLSGYEHPLHLIFEPEDEDTFEIVLARELPTMKHSIACWLMDNRKEVMEELYEASREIHGNS